MVSLGYDQSLIYERIWNLSRNHGGSSKTCGFTTGFEISGKFDFEVKIWKVHDSPQTSGTSGRARKLCINWENINIFGHTLGTFWNFGFFEFF